MTEGMCMDTALGVIVKQILGGYKEHSQSTNSSYEFTIYKTNNLCFELKCLNL